MAASQVDLGAFVGESARDRASDGTSGAVNYSDFVLEQHLHSPRMG
jgi:hypothetical protein